MTQKIKNSEVEMLMSGLNLNNQNFAITLLRAIKSAQDITVKEIQSQPKQPA